MDYECFRLFGYFIWALILVLELVNRAASKDKGASFHYKMPFWPVLPIAGLVMLLLAFIAIAISPLTRISVFAGVLWLVFLLVYYQIAVAPKVRAKNTPLRESPVKDY
ncbi:hypothetical protein [Heyndrickxia faecalis]|uniref:hypothetical protein n=1 Tax=Heyndrickxia faecalis TaxID=2824910 RepID=UPI003D1BF555